MSVITPLIITWVIICTSGHTKSLKKREENVGPPPPGSGTPGETGLILFLKIMNNPYSHQILLATHKDTSDISVARLADMNIGEMGEGGGSGDWTNNYTLIINIGAPA